MSALVRLFATVCALALGAVCVTAPAFGQGKEANVPARVGLPPPGDGRERPFLATDPGGHTAPVKAAFFHPNGENVVTVSHDRTVRLWDLGTGETLQVYRFPTEVGQGGMLYAGDISPDSRWIAAAGLTVGDGKHGDFVYLLSLQTGQVTTVLKGHIASGDAGKTWTFVERAKIGDNDHRDLFPAWPAKLALPPRGKTTEDDLKPGEYTSTKDNYKVTYPKGWKRGYNRGRPDLLIEHGKQMILVWADHSNLPPAQLLKETLDEIKQRNMDSYKELRRSQIKVGGVDAILVRHEYDAQLGTADAWVTTFENHGITYRIKLARLMAPATLILEDVDLIGTQRHMQTVDANALLFELLNQMDGLADDADILFVLTTNRPDILEPALASRPGRIDQAMHVPPPDAECRRRLLALYGRGLQLELSNGERLIERTAGVSGAFIRELLRKAAVFAAEDNGATPLVVRDGHIDEALTELLIAGGRLTQSLLGAAGVPTQGTAT